MTREELDRLWSDPKYWGTVYRCAEDPRVIVPKRSFSIGWTINFAHPLAGFALLLSIVIAVGPMMTLLVLGIYNVPILIVTLLTSIALLIALSHWEATRSRE